MWNKSNAEKTNDAEKKEHGLILSRDQVLWGYDYCTCVSKLTFVILCMCCYNTKNEINKKKLETLNVHDINAQSSIRIIRKKNSKVMTKFSKGALLHRTLFCQMSMSRRLVSNICIFQRPHLLLENLSVILSHFDKILRF